MRPILLSGHERALTQVKYVSTPHLGAIAGADISSQIQQRGRSNIFSRQRPCRLRLVQRKWRAIGAYKGHQGALWTVDVDPSTTLLATGGADNTIRLWKCRWASC